MPAPEGPRIAARRPERSSPDTSWRMAFHLPAGGFVGVIFLNLQLREDHRFGRNGLRGKLCVDCVSSVECVQCDQIGVISSDVSRSYRFSMVLFRHESLLRARVAIDSMVVFHQLLLFQMKLNCAWKFEI